MQTIKGIRIGGVPWGTRWVNIWFILINQPYNINLNHKGRANESVKIICLVLVKIYGNNPIKLLNKIRENKEINNKVLPLIGIRILNSLWRIKTILFQIILIREGINQNIGGIRKINKIDLNQFNLKLKFVEGSKDENKFIIIFNYLIFFYRKFYFY